MSRPARRNILFITSDQQHWRTLGRLNPEIRTPHLDRMAAEGTAFERAYCPNPTCTPTRSSIITGLYPSQHGAYSLGTKLAEHVPTVGGMLAAAGYETALVGKAHFQPLASTGEYPSLEAYPVLQDLEFWRGFHGPFYGFGRVELARNHADEAHVGQHYALWLQEKGCANWRDYFRPPTGTNAGQRHKWLIPERFHYGEWIAERTEALLEQLAARRAPFFLWASFFDPHPPYLVPEPWDTMYDPESLTVPSIVEGEHEANPPHFQLTQEERPDYTGWRESGRALHGFHSHRHDRRELARDIAVYYGMISLMDRQIGRILDRLDSLGLAEQTLVVFTSDHGHLFGQHGMTAKGAFHYEDLLKVPFIARCPGTVPAGRSSDALLSLVDMAPTFLGWTGVEAGAVRELQVRVPGGAADRWRMAGVDQSRVLAGAAAVRDHVLVENRHEPFSIHLKTWVDRRYKLTVYFNRPYGELFDLESDPGEVRNLWNDPASRALREQLTRRLLDAMMGAEPLAMPRVWGA